MSEETALATPTPPDEGYDWRCQRCLHQWRSRVPGVKPKACAKCRSAYWDKPHTVLPSVNDSVPISKTKRKGRNKRKKLSRSKREFSRDKFDGGTFIQDPLNIATHDVMKAQADDLFEPTPYGLQPPPHLRMPNRVIRNREDAPSPESLIQHAQHDADRK